MQINTYPISHCQICLSIYLFAFLAACAVCMCLCESLSLSTCLREQFCQPVTCICLYISIFYIAYMLFHCFTHWWYNCAAHINTETIETRRHRIATSQSVLHNFLYNPVINGKFIHQDGPQNTNKCGIISVTIANMEREVLETLKNRITWQEQRMTIGNLFLTVLWNPGPNYGKCHCLNFKGTLIQHIFPWRLRK